MFTISNGEIAFKEFAEKDDEYMQYVSWCRDLDTIKMLGLQKYLLSIDLEEIDDYVRALNHSQCDSFFKVYVRNDFVGTFKIGHIDWRLGIADMGIMIGNPSYKGKGYSVKIMKLGIEYAFHVLNLRRLTGGCYSKNIAMCKCFEKCGFQREGVMREALILDNEYCDHIFYGLLRKDYLLGGRVMSREKMVYCKKCLMPSTRPRISFNEKGVCNACQWAEEKKSFDWSVRWTELEKLCDKYRKRNMGRFDVIVPYSGGKDGGYIAWTLKNKLGMHPLVITIRPPMEDPVGEQNIKNFLERGYDHILITPNKRVGAYIDKENFINKGIPMHAHMIAIQAAIFRCAVLFDIPFVMFAEEGESEYGGTNKLKNQHTYDLEDSIQIYLSGVNPEKYLDKFTEEELYWYTFPSKEELVNLKPEISHWSYFEDFDNYKHYELAKKELGLLEKEERNTGSYENYATTDTYIIWLYYYLMYLKFGFGHTTHLAGTDIRRGGVTREEAITLVKKYDGEFPEQYVPYYLEYYDMTRDEFDAVLDKWANKELFVKKDGRWIPVFEVY